LAEGWKGGRVEGREGGSSQQSTRSPDSGLMVIGKYCEDSEKATR
jgi:hypothetical protein